jgi:hypothetical protein
LRTNITIGPVGFEPFYKVGPVIGRIYMNPMNSLMSYLLVSK